MLLAVAGTLLPGAGGRHQRPGRAAPGCATSRGTCCTSTPTSASAWPCPTSCGPARSSSTSPAATVYWWTLWGAAAAAVLVWRVGLPLWRSAAARPAGDLGGPRGARHRVGLRRPAAACTGCRWSRGQFLTWRFLGRPGWTRANPYSLSAAPDGRSLRITVKEARRRQRATRRSLRPGTRVARRGPLRPAQPHGPAPRHRVALIGAGVGVTPLRALAEGLDVRARATPCCCSAFRDHPLFAPRARPSSTGSAACRLLYLPGRRRSPDSWLGDGSAPPTTSRALTLVGAGHRRARRLRLRPAGVDRAASAARCAAAGLPPEQLPRRDLRMVTR